MTKKITQQNWIAKMFLLLQGNILSSNTVRIVMLMSRWHFCIFAPVLAAYTENTNIPSKRPLIKKFTTTTVIIVSDLSGEIFTFQNKFLQENNSSFAIFLSGIWKFLFEYNILVPMGKEPAGWTIFTQEKPFSYRKYNSYRILKKIL